MNRVRTHNFSSEQELLILVFAASPLRLAIWGVKGKTDLAWIEDNVSVVSLNLTI